MFERAEEAAAIRSSFVFSKRGSEAWQSFETWGPVINDQLFYLLRRCSRTEKRCGCCKVYF
jgi:hypothetical protein